MTNLRIRARHLVSLCAALFSSVIGCGGPSSYEGTWSGGVGAAGLHVHEVAVSKNMFPCQGEVALQYGTGAVMIFDVIWEQKEGHLQGMLAEKKDESIATVKLANGMLSGDVTLPVAIGTEPKRMSFSQFKKKPPAK